MTSLIVTPIVLNKLLDPENRWPWDIPGLKYGDVRIYKDDNTTVDIPFRMYAPALARGANITGIRQVMTDIFNGERNPTALAAMYGSNFLNQFLHRIGPLGRFTTTAATGHVAHMTQPGKFMQVADSSVENQLIQNLKKATLSAVPAVGEQVHQYHRIGETGKLDPVAQATIHTLAFWGAQPTVRGSEASMEGRPVRAYKSKISQTARDIAYKASQFTDSKDMQEYINKRLERDTPNTPARAMARAAIWSSIKSMKVNAAKSAALGTPYLDMLKGTPQDPFSALDEAQQQFTEKKEEPE